MSDATKQRSLDRELCGVPRYELWLEYPESDSWRCLDLRQEHRFSSKKKAFQDAKYYTQWHPDRGRACVFDRKTGHVIAVFYPEQGK